MPLHSIRSLNSPLWMSLIICHQSLKSWDHPPDELQSSTRKRWNPSWVVQSCNPRSNWCLPWYPQLHLEPREMPEDFWDALVIALYENKGNKANCGNYRGISFLSMARKILAWVILNQLITISEANLPEAQYGCHPGYSKVDIISQWDKFRRNA